MIMILAKEAIESISSELKLPLTGAEQDWEIELANPKRIDEFISFYKKKSLSSDEKKALMALILASYDELLDINEVDKNNLWHGIASLIRSEKDFFSEILDYWSVNGETDPENYFKITPFIRSIA